MQRIDGSDRNLYYTLLLHSDSFIFWAERNSLLTQLNLHDLIKWKAGEAQVQAAFIAFLKMSGHPPLEVDMTVPGFIATYR